MPPDSDISTDLIKMPCYALKEPHPSELAKQLEDLKNWEASPIQLNRVGALARGVCTQTLQRHNTLTLGFLGFCYIYLSQALSTVSLSLFEEPALILAFSNFLIVSIRARTHSDLT